MKIAESDWKLFMALKNRALDRYCWGTHASGTGVLSADEEPGTPRCRFVGPRQSRGVSERDDCVGAQKRDSRIGTGCFEVTGLHYLK